MIGALAQHYTVLDRYFCSFAGETFPNRFYQHAARTDRDHNNDTISTLPTIWDHLSPIANTQGVPTGGYFFRDLPFLALWGTKYFPFWHPFAAGDVDALGIPVTTLPFLDTVAQGLLPNVSFVDPAFDAHARDLGEVLERHPRRPVPPGTIPTSSQVLGPVSDAAAICSADSVPSVSPAPVRRGHRPAEAPALSPSGFPSAAGMVNFGRQHRGKI